MPKVSIYVPDDMYDALRRRELPMSQLAQRAFAEALASGANEQWIAKAASRPVRSTALPTEELMAAADEDFDEDFDA